MSAPTPATVRKRPLLLTVGGAHIDRRGRMTAEFVPGASIPGRMTEEVGGGAFNALRNAVQCGVAGAMMSMRGADSAGAMVAEAIAQAGIVDLSAVFLDRATPSYTALVDRHGDVLAGLADMGLYDIAFSKQMRRSKVRDCIAQADALFCDANLPAQALEALFAQARGKPVYAIGISPAKVVRLANCLAGLHCLFINRREASALAGRSLPSEPEPLVEALRGLGLRSAVVTDGAGDLVAFDASVVATITPPRLASLVDATGAGDALAGTATAAMMLGSSFVDAVSEGIAAAGLTLASGNAVARFDPRELAEAAAHVAQPRLITTASQEEPDA